MIRNPDADLIFIFMGFLFMWYFIYGNLSITKANKIIVLILDVNRDTVADKPYNKNATA